MGKVRLSRREFIQYTGAGALGAAASSLGTPTAGAEPDDRDRSAPGPLVRKVTEHLLVHCGPINVGIIHDGDKALLIDCGDEGIADALRQQGITSVQQVLFTHYHRDQACGAYGLADRGAKIGVPFAERDWFDKLGAYWNDPKSRWHTYGFHPSHLMLAEPLKVDFAVKDGDALTWGPAKVRVMATPGHTDGSVSYIVQVDGKRIIFSGDVIYGEGRVWDIYSLQKGFAKGGQQVGDYHGFLGARPELVRSLGRLKEAGATMLVPSHGLLITDPPKAMDSLVQRLNACYDQYVAISALRHYYPKLFTEFAGRKDHMPFAPTKPVPACLRHYGTSWVLVSHDKAAFVMDCGGGHVVKAVKKLVDQGEIRAVEGLWVTHYHDDHVDAIPEFLDAFKCPCITDRSVAEVISDPLAWRLPCISPNKARVDRATKDGESWQWHEFKLTAYHLPGQTLYHSGLLVEGQGMRMFFAGDSFTPAGIDDYCAQNRCWLGRDVGFDRCIALIEELKPTHLFNCHVERPWEFSPEQCRFMRENLARREELFGRLVPWNHANYGMDDSWVRCHPYEQRTKAGERVRLEVIVTNHSCGENPLACRAVLPRAWTGAGTNRPACTNWQRCTIPAKTDGKVAMTLTVPNNAPAGRHVIPVDIRYGPWNLPWFTEAAVVL